MTQLEQLKAIQQLRALRKQVSLHELQMIDAKARRRTEATKRALDECSEADTVAARFVATAMRNCGSRSNAATFFASMALGHRYAKLEAQSRRQHLDRMLQREKAVAAERAELAQTYSQQEKRHRQMSGIISDRRRELFARDEAAAEQEVQDIFAQRGRDGTS